MATENAPIQLSLKQPITSRDGSMLNDSRMVNCFSDAPLVSPEVVKRPGLTLLNGMPAGVAQGMFTNAGASYAIISGVAYNILTGRGIQLAGANAASGQFQSVSDAPYGTTFIKCATLAYVMTYGAVTPVTDANYPATTVPGVCYLDGTYYVMATNGTLQGSLLQTPGTWPALNFVQTDVSLGSGAALVRQLNYIVAICSEGTQLFYDAGNTTGIPLAGVSNAVWRTGSPAGASVVIIQDMCLFISSTIALGRTVSLINNGLSMVEISTPYINRILNLSTLVGLTAFGIKTAGHLFYVISLPDLNLTLVFDPGMQEWTQWTTTLSGTEGNFYPSNYINTGTQDIFQDPSTGGIYQMLPSIYQDNGSPINVRVFTPMLSWGTMAVKFFEGLTLQADTQPTTVYLTYSDDDYTTWSLPASVNMNTDWKAVKNLGSSRRRAFQFLHTDNTPLRIESGELMIVRGAS